MVIIKQPNKIQENIGVRMLVREALGSLTEVSSNWASKLSPSQLANANQLVEDALHERGRFREVYWQTSKGAKLSQNEQNYIVDRFFEGYTNKATI